MDYARFRLNGKLYRIEILRDNGEVLTGYEVDREGCPVWTYTRTTQSTHLLMVHRNDITHLTPLRMNNHYGELEEVK